MQSRLKAHIIINAANRHAELAPPQQVRPALPW